MIKQPKENNRPGPIERLKATRWWKPTCHKYASYLEAHKGQDCMGIQVGLKDFCTDVLNMPEQHRDEILKIDEAEYTEPARRYRQYDQPIPSELKIGTVTKRRR